MHMVLYTIAALHILLYNLQNVAYSFIDMDKNNNQKNEKNEKNIK